MTMLSRIWLVLVAALVAWGCAKSARAPASAPEPEDASNWGAPPQAAPGGSYSQPGYPSASYGAQESEATDSAAEAAPSAPEASQGVHSSRPTGRSAPPRQRPGLATVWGENRSSHVTSAPFYRAAPNRPFDTLSIHYNDAAGISAMVVEGSRSDYGDSMFPAAQRTLSVYVLDGGYQPLPEAHAGGRNYVVGEAGDRYVLRVVNHTGNRVEVVATVDGLDVLDGRPGSFAKRGYVLSPWGTLDIEGFRRSDSTVAAFRFGSVADSYAARKGDARNVGVIGIAFFDEAGARWPWTREEVRRRHDADPFPGRYAEPPPSW